MAPILWFIWSLRTAETRPSLEARALQGLGRGGGGLDALRARRSGSDAQGVGIKPRVPLMVFGTRMLLGTWFFWKGALGLEFRRHFSSMRSEYPTVEVPKTKERPGFWNQALEILGAWTLSAS